MKNMRLLLILLAVLVLALVAVLGVLIFKTQEYKAGEAFYQSLRTGALWGGRIG